MKPTQRYLAALGVGTLLLGTLAVAYQAKGNYCLLFGHERGDAVDLSNRWREQHYFFRGINVYDVFLAHPPKTFTLPAIPRDPDIAIDPELGVVGGSQPPWGYIAGGLLVWPSWSVTKYYFALINLASLLVLAAWAYRQARPQGLLVAAFLATAVSAVGGSCMATEMGQVGIVVSALLAGALWMDEYGQEVLAGILVGLSLVKPTISGPFVIALFLTRRYRAFHTTVLYLVAASLVAWAVTKTDPLTLLSQMFLLSTGYLNEGTVGLVDLFLRLGWPPRIIAPTLAALGGLATVVLVLAFARRSLPLAFAVAAVVGRLWTYHKAYDDVMLIFLLLPLGLLAASRPRVPALLLSFLAVGVGLWAPGRIAAHSSWQVFQIISWVLGLGILLTYSRSSAQEKGTTEPATSAVQPLQTPT